MKIYKAKKKYLIRPPYQRFAQYYTAKEAKRFLGDFGFENKLLEMKIKKQKQINCELVNALKRLLNAIETDKKISPSMDVLTAYETNGQAIKQAKQALKKKES